VNERVGLKSTVEQLAQKKVKKARKGNKEGQRWTDDRVGMILRLPVELKEKVIEEARVAGDLSGIVLFAMAHTNPKEVEVIQTRKTGLGLANPTLLHIGNEARVKLREWAEAESVSVNAIVVSMLEDFFWQLRKSRALRDELRQEIRAHRLL
jgi:hypothetical protein